MRLRCSKDTAKLRLTLLLLSDKAGCSPEMITAIKNDMIRVISRYMKIEKDAVRITMDAGSFSDGTICRLPVLRADIPIRSISSKGLY
ncbi:MAG: cell division topological specificity factor MinE [Lachnospiraceae bacterium]|nr:cell division topological specificity factor MinE [Clostridium sp.]MEE0671765.1 cell division topological specificity factor MinE [Enterocloster sp.]UYJ46079.1 MAG: cell division topological specificity factor MinE [Lachnospiraceae bacterium]